MRRTKSPVLSCFCVAFSRVSIHLPSLRLSTGPIQAASTGPDLSWLLPTGIGIAAVFVCGIFGMCVFGIGILSLVYVNVVVSIDHPCRTDMWSLS